jgi:hypothetical protein
MLRIITPEPLPAEVRSADSPVPEDSARDDLEIVLGRRQIASLALVGIVLLAVCTGAAYLAGRAAGPRPERRAAAPPVASPTAPEPAPEVPAPPMVAAAQEAPVNPRPAPPAAVKPAEPVNAAPALQTAPAPPPPAEDLDAALFAEPIPGARYLQVGSVDRGVAVILAEGLRTRGFNGFIATGAKEGVWRVLVGPLRTNAEYAAAKAAVDRMGVNTFTRQFAK